MTSSPDAVFRDGSYSDSGPEKGMTALREGVLTHGIPANTDGMSETRVFIWLTLLNVPPIQTDTYLDLVRQGASPAYAKIRNDTFRTLTSDPLFRRRVTENSLTRVLNAIAWKLQDAHEARVNGWMSPPTLSVPKSLDGTDNMFHSPASVSSRYARGSVTGTEGSEAGDAVGQVGYVQGMNVLAAPFLYAARSEAEAFAAFDRFITHECPGYVRGSMEGVHKGVALVDEILATVDPALSKHLLAHNMKAEIYAFPSVLTFCACTPPLPEVLILWDFLFAYGPHLNLLCIVAQMVHMRDALLDPNNHSPHPKFIKLDARAVILQTVSFATMKKIPAESDLWKKMLDHAK